MGKKHSSPAMLGPLVEAFALQKYVGGCTAATVRIYRWWLDRIAHEIPDTGSLDVVSLTRFFARLRERGLKPSSIHQAYRVVKTFTRWLLATDAMRRDPLKGFDRIKTPQTLPAVPAEGDVLAVVSACADDIVGRRNRAMILVLVDSGVRRSELLRLLVEHWNPTDRSLLVRGGKGRRDRITLVSATTARVIRDWLTVRPPHDREDFLFVTDDGRPIKARHFAQILTRLSVKAGLPRERRIHAHALRHLAATSWLRNQMPIEHVRRLLGHSSLDTTLIYSSLVSADLREAHRRAAALERILDVPS